VQKIQRIALTAGEPAGIGPDLCIQLCQHQLSCQLIVIADPELLIERAKLLKLSINIELFDPDKPAQLNNTPTPTITVYPASLASTVRCGQLNISNSPYVVETIKLATQGCIDGVFDAMVTAPVNKAVINNAGIHFTGHTEYIADITGGFPVMMLATPGLRVALLTTHIPLSDVSRSITTERLKIIIPILDKALRHQFAIESPVILVCGLNPHAGEDGHLGREEIETITPALTDLAKQGINLQGPLPADTLFTPKYLETADAVLAMYHDQGLPVLKHMGFGQAVNITLGLPIIRTSVDHGTALDLAGTGKANMGSLEFAIKTAQKMAQSHTLNR
jgi:4-hydroxythreonine-4-phosphate dehydrogenase